MKKAKIVLMASTLMLLTAGVFAFKANKKFSAASFIYLGSSSQIATPTGHWYTDDNGGAASLATLTYGTSSSPLTYDQVDQIYFEP